MSIWQDKFTDWCSALTIDSKDEGLVPLHFFGTQRKLINEIAAGLEDDIRHFVVLKGRQLGISTASLALDCYWPMSRPGVQGALVVDTDSNRDYFRDIISGYLGDGLPKSHKQPVTGHNRTQLTWKNRSRLLYLVAGTRKGGGLGRAKGVNFLHATEMSSWGDEEGLASLQSTLSQKSADRLYIYESTARGFDMFYDMWKRAKNARTQRAIFIGWWLKESYSWPKDSVIYQTYWDGQLSSDERDWVRKIKMMYDYDIQPEQIAWHRHQLAEIIGDELMMTQEFPPTESDAFVVTGSQFFSGAALTLSTKIAQEKAYEAYRYVFGDDFTDTTVIRANEYVEELRVWAYPIPGATYVLGCDPAYGSSDWADRFCVQVFRCYADRLEQVAEYATEKCSTVYFAWVIAHLAGAYRPSFVNLEITGPGGEVLARLDDLRRRQVRVPSAISNTGFLDVLGATQHYLYRRPDDMAGSFARQWKTTHETKKRMMNRLRDEYSLKHLVLHSVELIEEMGGIRNEDGEIGAKGRAKDDRVIAAALAVVHWWDWIKERLRRSNYTYDMARKLEARDSKPPIEDVVMNYLKGVRVVQ